MRQMVDKMLRYYGRPVRVLRGEKEITVRCFLQPVTGRNRNLTRIDVGPLGTQNTGQCVYIGPVEPEIFPGDTLDTEGKPYILRRIELIDGGNGPAYRWGICVEKGAEEAWGVNG